MPLTGRPRNGPGASNRGDERSREREHLLLAGLEPDERCSKRDKEHQRWVRSRSRLVQLAKRDGSAWVQARPRGARRRSQNDRQNRASKVGPLKLARVIPSLRTDDQGREPPGLESAPQLTLLVHERASRDERAVRSTFRRESDTPARIRRSVQRTKRTSPKAAPGDRMLPFGLVGPWQVPSFRILAKARESEMSPPPGITKRVLPPRAGQSPGSFCFGLRLRRSDAGCLASGVSFGPQAISSVRASPPQK